MAQKNIQGKCISCNSSFPVEILQDDIVCPVCGEYANITAICPNCGENIDTNGRALGCCYPCPACNEEFIWNTVESTDGSPMVVSMTGRVEMHDIAAALAITQNQLSDKNEIFGKENASLNTKSAGCLTIITTIVGMGLLLLSFVYLY